MISLVSRYSPLFPRLKSSKIDGCLPQVPHICRPHFVKASSNASTTSGRNFSVLNKDSIISLKDRLAGQIDSYGEFLTLTNQESR